ncbi:MAG: DUF294 nucleotidyltransferase-like domain-containing protein [Bacteroidales bacterium]|nr:DUF294 nucleotidyltransferase-like domain-containing protein [Bacteroidales bacterium]MCF8392106.1 DUF294 nucleotidyltransferase-like domain-containing protein [Bacteroidales bacterium]
MADKKEMISELTNTAWSLLDEYNQEFENFNLSLEDAQKMAAFKIEQMRYGKEYKDYFWIIDQHPTMIMHPYKHELISSDLINYRDPNGIKVFVEATKIVAEKGEGFIEYMWQWKDDSTKIVQKLSYVKAYEPWGWIIGTGIYLEDVKQEIKILKNNLLRISLIITLIIVSILLYVIHQSLIIQNKKRDAESKLLLSRQKYKALVDASTEGTLMIINQSIIFSNLKFSKLIKYEPPEILTLEFEDIFNTQWNKLIDSFEDPGKSISMETQIRCKDGTESEVILTISKINYAEDLGYIIVTKELSPQRLIERETEFLNDELQSSLLLMNQPIKPLIREVLKCSVDTSIQNSVLLMKKKERNILFVHRDNEIIGVINTSDLKNRVLAENLNLGRPVVEIMTSPVVTIPENALFYEAMLLYNRKNISHLATINQDGKITGVIGYIDSFEMQKNYISFLLKEIEAAEDIKQLNKLHTRNVILVNALLESGDKTQNITRIVSAVSDAILSRIILLVFEDLGEPPCEFAFMVMGSEGRMEQTLYTDQDNAIVIDNKGKPLNESESDYFLNLGKLVSSKLNEAGYSFCKGDVMASNPRWNQSIDVWKEYFTNWINNSDPQSILDANIFFDFRFVFGRKSLIDDLRSHINEVLVNKSIFFYHMALSVLKYKPPLSLFGNVIGNNHTENSIHIDIKKILLPIISFVRLYALKYQVDETNSLYRINQLSKQQVINKSINDELILAYNFLMHIRFRFQCISILENKSPDNRIDINKLTQFEVFTIKKIFATISELQTLLNFDYKSSI